MLSVVDYIVLSAMLLAFLTLGFVFRTKEDTTVDEYLMCNRNMSPWPVGVSIAVTMYSGVALTVVLGEVYLYGAPVWTGLLAGIAAHLIINATVVPHFYRSKYASVYQYIEERFSRSLRLFATVVFFAGGLLFVAVATYVACMAINVVTDIPFWLSALVVGGVCTLYSAVGGIKAVIWTDVIQALTMFLFSFMIFGKVFSQVESFSSFVETGINGGRLHLSVRDGPTVRYSLPSFFSTYLIYWIGFLTTNQACIQRWQCTSTLKKAQKSVTFSMWICGCFGICSYLSGVCLYVFYNGCDVLTTKIVDNSERISLHFMVTNFGHLPGLVGLALSGVLNGSFSTFSSVVNSFAAVTLEDFIKPLLGRSISNSQQILLCKVFTIFYGAACTGLVFVVAYSGSAIVVQAVTLAVTTGPMIAVIYLGLFCRKASAKSVALSLVITIAFISWMSIGSLLSDVEHDKLPLDVSECPQSYNISFIGQNGSSINEHGEDKYTFSLYTVSFYWLSPISLLVASLLGIVFSYTCFGNKRNEDPTLFYTFTCCQKKLEHIDMNTRSAKNDYLLRQDKKIVEEHKC